MTTIIEQPRFETSEISGARLLSADGCFARHLRPRNEATLTDQENFQREFKYRNSAERDEQSLLNDAWMLRVKGILWQGQEPLEEFVSKHIHALEWA